MIKAIIFDFDGVILESASIKTDAFAEMVEAYPVEIGKKFVEFHLTHMGISRKVKFQYLIGSQELQQMKPTAFLVNTSRGAFIDEDALYAALQEKKIAGAALDVFSEEPYKGKLCELEQVILTPHIASSAKEGRAVMEMEAAKNVLKGLGIQYD